MAISIGYPIAYFYLMGQEIERKFLVEKLPEGYQNYPSKTIRQGYLGFTEEGRELRLRQANDQFYFTVKSAGELVRQEVEVNLSEAQFQELWPLTEGKRVSKVRYLLKENEATIELDVYTAAHKGLAVAEVEFATVMEAENFNPPSWMGTEVTGETAYKNRNLALKQS